MAWTGYTPQPVLSWGRGMRGGEPDGEVTGALMEPPSK
jgi:hypothetical protein